jgi:type II secretory pathway component PulM
MIIYAQAKAHWQKLTSKEQLMLMVGGIFLGIFLLYQLIYAPIQNTITSQQQQLEDSLDTLDWIRKVTPQIQQASHAKSIQSTALLSVLQNELSTQSFKSFPYQLSQSNATDIDLRFKKAPFNALMVWLWKLSKQYVFEIYLLEAKRTNTQGICEVHIILKAKE